jgi:glucokinase
MKIIAADIGGTNSRFGYFSMQDSPHATLPTLEKSSWLKTSSFVSFAELLTGLESSEFPLKLSDADIVVFAVAGPVQESVYCVPPLIDWDVDLRIINPKFKIKRAILINDFLAQALSAVSPLAASARQILSGKQQPNQTISVIGAGTGLGKGLIAFDEVGNFTAVASEGAHVNFAVESKEEYDFQNFALSKTKGNYLTWNNVMSGSGLSLIHEYLKGENLSPAEVAEKFSQNAKVLEWVARFYGRVCRNFALETLSLGGQYVAGGVAAKNPVIVDHLEFAKSFRDSYAHKELLAQIPLFLLDNQESGLWGSAIKGAQLIRQ